MSVEVWTRNDKWYHSWLPCSCVALECEGISHQRKYIF